jgi:ubiquinone biosynthesis protein UbiJ
MLAAPAAALINHLLRGAPWARERLAPFAGKTARISVFPTLLTLTALDSGEVVVAHSDAVPCVEISLSPSLLPRLLLKDEAAYREVAVSGDTAFASEIAYIMKNLSWDAGEDLSHVFGDVVAHRITRSAAAFAGWPGQAALSVAQMLSEYWTEEQPVLAKGHHVQRFIAEVDVLRDDAERMGKRLQLLQQAVRRTDPTEPSGT